jgi:hypothetical protein
MASKVLKKKIVNNLINSGANNEKIKRTLLEIYSATESKIPKDNVKDYFSLMKNFI